MTGLAIIILAFLPQLARIFTGPVNHLRHGHVSFASAPLAKSGMVQVAIPRRHWPHTRVWLNGRELKRGGLDLPEGDFIPTEMGIMPCRRVYAEWMWPNSRIEVRY